MNESFLLDALEDPAMTFAILKKLENDGSEYARPISTLTDDDRREVLLAILVDLKRQDMH